MTFQFIVSDYQTIVFFIFEIKYLKKYIKKEPCLWRG